MQGKSHSAGLGWHKSQATMVVKQCVQMYINHVLTIYNHDYYLNKQTILCIIH